MHVLASAVGAWLPGLHADGAVTPVPRPAAGAAVVEADLLKEGQIVWYEQRDLGMSPELRLASRQVRGSAQAHH